jgi:hypothetical protein
LKAKYVSRPNFSLDRFQMIAFASAAGNNAAVLPRARTCPRAKNLWTILDRKSAFSCTKLHFRKNLENAGFVSIVTFYAQIRAV